MRPAPGSWLENRSPNESCPSRPASRPAAEFARYIASPVPERLTRTRPTSPIKLQSRHPAGMYTRLLRPAPHAYAGRLLAPFGAFGNVMARLVMKFGGTSVADLDRIRNVARHVKREVEAGHDVAVVVSAMSGVTNQLVEWCRQAAMLHDAREYDAVV